MADKFEYVKYGSARVELLTSRVSDLTTKLEGIRGEIGIKTLNAQEFVAKHTLRTDQDPVQVIVDLKSRHTALTQQLQMAQSVSRESTGELLSHTAKFQVLQKAQAFYLDFQEKVTKRYIYSLEGTLNEVFQYVYQKPSKSVSLTLEESYGKQVVKVKTVRVSGKGTATKEDLDESGFSVSVVLGTIMLLYFIMLNKIERVVFLDEALGGLSARSTERFYQVLRQFVTEHGFKFFIVSHDEKVAPFADRVYYMENGSVRTISEPV